MYKCRNCMKLFSFFPAIVMMLVIFWFSSQPADDSSRLSISFSLTLIKEFLRMLNKSMSDSDLLLYAESIHIVIRKAAHFSEYALLSLSIAFPFLLYNKKEQKHFFQILAICSLYACTDEFHQFFVPGRACRFLDICIDTSGAALSLLIIYFIVKISAFLSSQHN